MTRQERIKLYEQVTGKRFDRELIELERRNPWAAKVLRERRARARRVEAAIRSRRIMDAMTPRKYTVGFITESNDPNHPAFANRVGPP